MKLVSKAAEREDKNHTRVSNVDAAVWLHERAMSLKLTATSERSETEQVIQSNPSEVGAQFCDILPAFNFAVMDTFMGGRLPTYFVI